MVTGFCATGCHDNCQGEELADGEIRYSRDPHGPEAELNGKARCHYAGYVKCRCNCHSKALSNSPVLDPVALN